MDKIIGNFLRRFSKKYWAAWATAIFFGWCCVHATPFMTDDKNPPREKTKDKVHLVHADNWIHDQFAHPDAQCFSGKVEFLHGGLRMFCDSAVLFQTTNSFEAFGHVKMLQGDTLSLTGDYLFYDGETQIAQIRHHVVMTHRNSVLLTDSLNYDRLYNVGYFFEGGKLIDGENTLTSDWGEYYTSTRKSSFNYNVKLENSKYTLISDTLHYDTQTKWADVSGPSNIYSGESRIYTERGFYNTDTQKAELFSRTVYYNKGRKMEGDSVYYDKNNGIMTAYHNIVYEDSQNKNILMGDYCRYNELTGEALATRNALVKDFSSSDDTLFVHADTLRLYTYNMDTDSIYRVLHGYFHVRAYRTDIQAVCDSLVFNSQLKRLTLYRDPIVWNERKQILGEEINVFTNDSTIDSIYVERQALLVEQIDSLHFNQIAGQDMRSFFQRGEMKENQVNGNVRLIFYPLEKDSTVLYQNYTETSKMRMFMKDRKMTRIWAPASQGQFYPVGLAPREKTYLDCFAWFDYIRPLSKHDLFEWRGKKAGTELKASIRREAPLQIINKPSATTP